MKFKNLFEAKHSKLFEDNLKKIISYMKKEFEKELNVKIMDARLSGGYVDVDFIINSKTVPIFSLITKKLYIKINIVDPLIGNEDQIIVKNIKIMSDLSYGTFEYPVKKFYFDLNGNFIKKE